MTSSLPALRHAFAVELEQADVPVTVISALLGHSSVAVTARYLNHLTNHQAVTALAAARPEPPQGRLQEVTLRMVTRPSSITGEQQTRATGIILT
jgi:hypothetical protein